jgi:hypothetical protein
MSDVQAKSQEGVFRIYKEANKEQESSAESNEANVTVCAEECGTGK